jgi:glycosyltransferase involved in cell wall biosynthesis
VGVGFLKREFAAWLLTARSRLRRKPQDAHERYLRMVEVARREALPVSASSEPLPLISFVTPVHNTPVRYLDDLLRSFRAQARGLSEWVLSDDGSSSKETDVWLRAHASEEGLVILRRAENKGIAVTSNEGVAASRGRWIGLVDHDDALAPQAAALLARAIGDHPDAKFLYTDELIADGDLRGVDFFHKPAFDDVLLSGVNYINHLSLYRRDLFDAIGGFRLGFDGSQDYDLLLRYLAGLAPSEILHLPYPAYIWRRDGASYSVKFLEKATANARRALAQAYGADVDRAINPDLHRVRLDARDGASLPKISIILANRGSLAQIHRLIEGLTGGTDYANSEIVVVGDEATDPEALAFCGGLASVKSNFTVPVEPASANISHLINVGMARATGDFLLCLDSGIEIIEPSWLTEMAACFRYPRAGIVGARLLHPDRTLRHGGLIVGLGGLAGPWFERRPADWAGPMARLNVRSSMSAVSGACMMISRECWEQVGELDDELFGAAHGDVDFCLRARGFGWRAVYTPFATLIQHPSSGRDDRARILRDQAALIERHGTKDFQDPYFSPWYDRARSEPTPIPLEETPSAR